MYVEKETEKALLVVHNAVSFWIQRRWMKNGKLLPAGMKAYREAEKKHWQHFEFDALKEFDQIRQTEKAILLSCAIELINGHKEYLQFWVPRSMINNWEFVSRKIKELEDGYPFIGARILWSGNNAA